MNSEKVSPKGKIDLARVTRLRRGGYSIAQIAEDQGVTRNAIWKRLQNMEPLPEVELLSSPARITIKAPGVDHEVLAVALARALNRLGYSATPKRGTHKNEEA